LVYTDSPFATNQWAMFKSLGLFQTSKCPGEPCLRPYCFFAHSQATVTAGPSRAPVQKTGTTSTSRAHREIIRVDERSAVRRPVESPDVTDGKRKRSAKEDVHPGMERDPRSIKTTKISSAVASSLTRPSASGNSTSSARPALPAVSGSNAAQSTPAQANGAPSVSRDAKDLKSSRHPYADRQKACTFLHCGDIWADG
jgi:hypothetical protein